MLKHVVTETYRRLIPTIKKQSLLGWQSFTRAWGPVFTKDWSRLLRLLQPLFFLAALFLVGQATWIYCGVQPATAGGSKVRLEIPRGSSVSQVARLLEEKQLINSRNSFIWYVYLTGRQNQIKAGHYLFDSEISFSQLLKELGRGRPVIHLVTIREGLRAQEITDLLAAKGIIDKTKFQKLLKDGDFLRRHLPEFAPSSAEGFLFPDTYEFAEGMSEEEIAAAFFRQFRRIWGEVSAQGLSSDRLSLVDRIILASMVESEAKVAEEREIISSIFLNRLKRGYPLQSCATVQYALGERKSRLLYKDLEYESPYNTYKYYGLPPGPISNPGRASLEAALRPAKTDFLYFVARSDGSHIFSRSYREHLNAQRGVNAGNS